MNRRRFLAAGLSGVSTLAGCLGGASDTDSSSTESTGTTAETRTATGTRTTDETRTTTEPGSRGGANRTVTVADAGTLEAGDVSVAIDLSKSEITADHTAEVVFSLRNRTSASVTLSYTLPRGLNVVTGSKSNGDARLLLVGEGEQWNRTDGCWQPDARTLARGMPDTERSITLSGGETRREPYRLWNHPENASCFPAGTYEFARAFRRNDSESTWRFGLSLS
ncbi:hypothetical protein BG842_14605 [Haladaptatus sp. W1]|uniref:hypothetical protein n=1 Tax=Haladaptatus sp. W1 TaxID=1897478 RepID=UPI00084999D6|nr:hypothetical protein [Haladaptatus sp. W1]ODR81364.1 hypothetical protein BG842_14605 [Haladaptatus sp. W1]